MEVVYNKFLEINKPGKIIIELNELYKFQFVQFIYTVAGVLGCNSMKEKHTVNFLFLPNLMFQFGISSFQIFLTFGIKSITHPKTITL